jgi:hypothetical protein
MSPAAKTLANGTLIFLEIIIVVVFILSLAAIAVVGSLCARKRYRISENPDVGCLIDSVSNHHAAG